MYAFYLQMETKIFFFWKLLFDYNIHYGHRYMDVNEVVHFSFNLRQFERVNLVLDQIFQKLFMSRRIFFRHLRLLLRCQVIHKKKNPQFHCVKASTSKATTTSFWFSVEHEDQPVISGQKVWVTYLWSTDESGFNHSWVNPCSRVQRLMERLKTKAAYTYGCPHTFGHVRQRRTVTETFLTG